MTLIYLLKVSACSIVFYLVYQLMLSKLTFFKFNRFYLLGTLALSFIIPALQLEVVKEVKSISTSIVNVVPINKTDIKLPPIKDLNTASPALFNWDNLIVIAYASIGLGILGFYIFKLLQVYYYARKYNETINGLKIIYKQTGFTNCSFFNYVFVNNLELKDNELSVMLNHEAVHAKQYHSIDKLLLMFFKSVLWFNPIIYLYDKALEQTHEYEADEETSRNIGTNVYANLLLKLATVRADMPMVHNFVKSPIKERIKMLFNQKSKNMRKLVYLLAMPIALGLFCLFSLQFVYAQPKVIVNPDGTHSTIIDNGKTKTVVNPDGTHSTIIDNGNYSIIDNINKNDNFGCNITKIDCDANYTIISFSYKATKDNDWATLNKEMYIQANNDMRHFQYVKSEHIPLVPNKYIFAKAGDVLDFKVYFEKVPLTAKSIDIIERAGKDNYFNFYNVELPLSYYAEK